MAGRFRLELPSSFDRVEQRSTLKEVDIVEVDVPRGMSPEEVSRQFWAEHVSEIKSARRNDAFDTVVDESRLDDGTPCFHYSDPTTCVPVFEALRPYPTHLVLFKAGDTFHPVGRARSTLFAAESLEHQRRTTLEVLGSYRVAPEPRGAHLEWFHTPYGIVAPRYVRERQIWTDDFRPEHQTSEERLILKLEVAGLELSFFTWFRENTSGSPVS